MAGKAKVVVLGGGFGGAYAAQVLSRSKDCDLTVLDRHNYLLFYPLLVEAGVGALEPRHVVVPSRLFMKDGDFKMAEVLDVDLRAQIVKYQVIGCPTASEIKYDHLVLSLGSISKNAKIPGLAEFGFEFKTLSDAVQLRDRGIALLELANTMTDPEARKDLLRHVVVGANFTGVEFAGEYQAFLKNAAKHYPSIRSDDIEVIIVEHGERILPAVGPDLSLWADKTLRRRGVQICTGTSVTEIGEKFVVLTDGRHIKSNTVVWAAGIAPNPLISSIEGLPLNVKGYIDCEPDLRVKGFTNVWAVGDCATVYDSGGKPYAATAQTASRQGPLVGKNIIDVLAKQPTKPFKFKPLGSFAAIGHRSAAADFLGKNFKGFFGWFLYRGTYLMKMPTFPMKVRLAMDWFLELILRSEVVQLGAHHSRRDR